MDSHSGEWHSEERKPPRPPKNGTSVVMVEAVVWLLAAVLSRMEPHTEYSGHTSDSSKHRTDCKPLTSLLTG